MNITINEVEPHKLSVHYEASPEEILNKRGDVLTTFKRAPVPGFRPGKAPLDAVKMHYRTQIEHALKAALTEDAFHNTVAEKRLRVLGAPAFNTMNYEDGKFTCEFNVHTKPDFELSKYLELEIPKPAAPFTVPELANKMLEDLRHKLGDTAPFGSDDVVVEGDNIIVDYEGFYEGNKIDSLSVQGDMITVGQSGFEGFDSNLIGMKIDDTKEFSLIAPANALPSFAGKEVTFKVTLVMGSKTTPCALDDDMAKKIGKKDFAELMSTVNVLSKERVDSHVTKGINEAIYNRLLADNEFTPPNWLSLSEAKYLAHNAKLDWDKLPDIDKEKYLEMAAKNVKMSLIFDKIREEDPMAQLSDQEAFDMIKSNLLKAKLDKPIDDVMKEMNKTGQFAIVMSRLKDEYVLDYIVKSAKIIE